VGHASRDGVRDMTSRNGTRGGRSEVRAGDMTMRQESPPMRLYRRLGHTDLSAVGETRAALREFLRYRRRPEETEVAELLLSELVTNALIHTRNGAVVTVTSAP